MFPAKEGGGGVLLLPPLSAFNQKDPNELSTEISKHKMTKKRQKFGKLSTDCLIKTNFSCSQFSAFLKARPSQSCLSDQRQLRQLSADDA